MRRNTTWQGQVLTEPALTHLRKERDGVPVIGTTQQGARCHEDDLAQVVGALCRLTGIIQFHKAIK